MTDITKDDFLAYDDSEIKKVNIPGLKGDIYIRTVTAAEKDSLEKHITNNSGHIRARYVALATCDKDGNRLFDDADFIKISKKSVRLVDQLFQAICELNSASPEEIEEMAKNS